MDKALATGITWGILLSAVIWWISFSLIYVLCD